MKILITGGGFLGRHLAESFAADPSVECVRVLTRSENHVAQIATMCGGFRTKSGLPKVEFVLGDVTFLSDCHRASHGMDAAIHTAAMKHVDLCRDNPSLAISTNISGTSMLVHNGPGTIILCSTDKAVAPTTAYGATKLLAERLVLHAGTHGLRAMVWRSGNLFASDGSVVPRWRESLRLRNEIEVTDPEMTRWMIKIDDAVAYLRRMLLEGESGKVYVPPMRLVRLRDLADAMIDLYGTFDGSDIRKFAGLRPGEKMHETLAHEDDVLVASLPGQASHNPAPVSVAELKAWIVSALRDRGNMSSAEYSRALRDNAAVAVPQGGA